MLRLENVTKTHATRQGPVHSLKDLSLEVKTGEFLLVRGPSGCGKTTLLLVGGGMLRPSAGQVKVGDQNIYRLSAGQRNRFRARTIGFVFQMFHLVPYLSVVENVMLATPAGAGTNGLSRARELLAQLGLENRWQHKPGALSAGERQRTAIARALFNQPKLILADEPTGNLDPENGAEVVRHLAAFHRAGGTVIMVTHGQAADEVADRVVELRAGSIRQ